MTRLLDDGQVTLYYGHVLDVLREIPDASVQCVVTSPPYWALRAYGTEAQVWGGDPECRHHWIVAEWRAQTGGQGEASVKQITNEGSQEAQRSALQSTCQKCGAWRGELGHEPTTQMFVSHLVEVFREVRRVLKSDGCCFVNLGDSYSGSGPMGTHGRHGHNSATWGAKEGGKDSQHRVGGQSGTKPKSLILIPERFAIAMADDGWIVRSRIAWCKRAPMPESVRDRPTSAWEHIWMFTKSGRYFWDQDAVRESHSREWWTEKAPDFNGGKIVSDRVDGGNRHGLGTPDGRNLWNYWLLSPDPEPLAHFATFPREIPRRCIAAATREGDTVLDPFVGSGTTTMVARSMLRRAIGIDLNETYLCEIALKKNAQMALMGRMETSPGVGWKETT